MNRKMIPGLALAFAVLAAPQAFAEDDHHHHHGDTSNKKAVKLEEGKRYPTDEPLRKGMTQIRELVATNLPAAHEGKLDKAGYEKLGKQVNEQIAYLFANCKLTPEADQVLHDEVLHDLMEGTKIVQADGKRVKGMVRMLNGLNAYGKLFDHPGWKPIKH